MNKRVQKFLFEKQHEHHKKPLLLELTNVPNKWVNYYLRYQQLDELVESLQDLEKIYIGQFSGINLQENKEYLKEIIENSIKKIKLKNFQLLNLADFFHHQKQFFIESITRYLLAQYKLESLTQINYTDIENKIQSNAQKIENFFINILPKFSSKNIKLRQYNALCCPERNQLSDNTILNYININLFIQRLETTYQLNPSDLNFHISLILEEFLNSIFKNPDQLFVLQHTKKLSFIPFAKIDLFIACDSIDNSTEYFKNCDLNQISFDHFDNSEILKTCGYISVIREQKKLSDSNQKDQLSKKFFEGAANLGCEDSKNILDQFYQSKPNYGTEMNINRIEIIKNYGCVVIKPNVLMIRGIPMIIASEKALLKQNLWSLWYQISFNKRQYRSFLVDELRKIILN